MACLPGNFAVRAGVVTASATTTSTPANLKTAISPTAAGVISAPAKVTRRILGTSLFPSAPHMDEATTAVDIPTTTALMMVPPTPQLATAQMRPTVAAR